MELKTDEESVSNLLFYIRDNNEEARDILYEKFSPLIHKEINSFKSRAIALGVDMADLSQEAMLGFSHAINNYNEEEDTKFITFATLCIRRRLMNYVNKFDTNKNKVMMESLALDMTLDEEEKNSIVDNIVSANSDPLSKLINSETLRELKDTMDNKLSDAEREALGYDLSGKSVEEIASLMNKSNKQIYNLIFRARQKMKI